MATPEKTKEIAPDTRKNTPNRKRNNKTTVPPSFSPIIQINSDIIKKRIIYTIIK